MEYVKSENQLVKLADMDSRANAAIVTIDGEVRLGTSHDELLKELGADRGIKFTYATLLDTGGLRIRWTKDCLCIHFSTNTQATRELVLSAVFNSTSSRFRLDYSVWNGTSMGDDQFYGGAVLAAKWVRRLGTREDSDQQVHAAGFDPFFLSDSKQIDKPQLNEYQIPIPTAELEKLHLLGHVHSAAVVFPDGKVEIGHDHTMMLSHAYGLPAVTQDDNDSNYTRLFKSGGFRVRSGGDGGLIEFARNDPKTLSMAQYILANLPSLSNVYTISYVPDGKWGAGEKGFRGSKGSADRFITTLSNNNAVSQRHAAGFDPIFLEQKNNENNRLIEGSLDLINRMTVSRGAGVVLPDRSVYTGVTHATILDDLGIYSYRKFFDQGGIRIRYNLDEIDIQFEKITDNTFQRIVDIIEHAPAPASIINIDCSATYSYTSGITTPIYISGTKSEVLAQLYKFENRVNKKTGEIQPEKHAEGINSDFFVWEDKQTHGLEYNEFVNARNAVSKKCKTCEQEFKNIHSKNQVFCSKPCEIKGSVINKLQETWNKHK